MPTRIFLVRHGATTLTAEDRIQRLAPLTLPGGVYRPLALEQTAIAHVAAGERAEAIGILGLALSLLSGLTPSAQDGAVRQLFLAPEPTYTLSAWEDGINAVHGMPSDAQPTAFIRLLLELAEDRARSYLNDARTSEIRIGLTRFQSHAPASSQATATR